jgi:hypothetical protein
MNNPIVPLFLLKSFSILENAPADIICWSEDGESFIVKDSERFSNEIIPSHFKHNKFTSFVRQLNFYGFRKVKGKLNNNNKNEQNQWEFKHPYFRRGRPDLLQEIKRASSHNEEANDHASIPNSHHQHHNESYENTNETEYLRQQVIYLNSKVDELSNKVIDMQMIIDAYRNADEELRRFELNSTYISSSPAVPSSSSQSGAPLLDFFEDTADEEWCLEDDQFMKSILEDISESQPEDVPQQSLKRPRYGDDIQELMRQPYESTNSIAQSVPNITNLNTSKNIEVDSALITKISDAVTASVSAASIPVDTFENYLSAVSALISCTGIEHAADLAQVATIAHALHVANVVPASQYQQHQALMFRN